MGGPKNSNYFYKDKPLFGLDIGFSSIKVMQLTPKSKGQYKVQAYGVGTFDSKAIHDGIVEDHKSLAASILQLFNQNLTGRVTTNRVAITVPTSRVFTRTMNLPALKNDADLRQAVSLEIEQYVPIALDSLYVDYNIIYQDSKSTELLAVAAPKRIVDSYVSLAYILGLDPIAFDTSITAGSRLFEKQIVNNDTPAVLIDFGSTSADITIHDKAAVVTGTIPCGGDVFTNLISEKLGVTKDEAHIIKTKYGLDKSKKQKQIVEALTPDLEKIVKEIKRMLRYHEERSNSRQKIGQIVTMGGGSNMPGLSDYLTSMLRLPVRTYNPWQNLDLGRLDEPSATEKSVYSTVAGLAFIDSKELFV